MAEGCLNSLHNLYQRKQCNESPGWHFQEKEHTYVIPYIVRPCFPLFAISFGILTAKR